MDTDDEDVFALNDEEDVIIDVPQAYNPVEENLIRQLNEVEEQIERGKRQNDKIKLVSDKILDKLRKKALYYDHDSSTSSSDGEHYDEAGVPVSKRQRKRKNVGTQALVVTEVWQRIADDKWIIGVDLQNTSCRQLTSPIVYVTIKGQRELQGVTCLWEMSEGGFWERIDELSPDGGHTVATVVLDMPTFEDSDVVEGHGIITYDIEGSLLQVPIQSFSMTAAQAVDKLMTPRYSTALQKSMLAIKAASVERIVCLSMGQDLWDNITSFMEENGFYEILKAHFGSRNTETFRHCIIELLVGLEQVQLRISARSTSQKNIILHLLRGKIPEMSEINKHDKLLEGAIALEREIELRLDGNSPREILNASIITDLFIPE